MVASVRSILHGSNSGIHHIFCSDTAHSDDWISGINVFYAGNRAVDICKRKQVGIVIILADTMADKAVVSAEKGRIVEVES